MALVAALAQNTTFVSFYFFTLKVIINYYCALLGAVVGGDSVCFRVFHSFNDSPGHNSVYKVLAEIIYIQIH